MKNLLTFAAAISATTVLASSSLLAGPYAPAAGVTGTGAIAKDDTSFVGWVTSVVSYAPGSNVDDTWKDLDLVLGAPGSDVYDIVSLGRGGNIILSFEKPIANGDGWDLAVFENSFGDGFLELAYVEVSSDGVNYVRFPNDSQTASAVGAYANNMDPTNIDGLAGKYRQGFGTPFDLSALSGVSGVNNVNLNRISHVRIVDIIGDGTYLDSDGDIIYDPYPTIGSAGFDLDAVGVRYYASNTGWQETWFGNAYLFSESANWIFSSDNEGYQYYNPIDETSAYFYDHELGWLYADSGSYPHLYLYDLNQWVYFYNEATGSERWYCIWDDTLNVAQYPYATDTELSASIRR